MNRNLLIYNPVSGKINSKEDYLGKIVQSLTEDGSELTVYQTQGKDDARRYLENKSMDYSKVICCGGDGTLHEVVNGIIKADSDAVVGYIPLGSTNDYAKNLGINKENAVQYIKEEVVSYIDIGNFNGEYFSYVAAFGALANVTFLTPQKVKNTLGYFAYLLEGVKHLSDIKANHIKFQADDIVIEDDILLGMITNSFSVAGIKNRNTNITKLNDGLMEYLLIKMPKNLLELQAIVTLLLSEKFDEKYMYFGQATQMNVLSEEMAWTLDGEDGGVHKEVNIKVCSQALRLIVGMRGIN